MCGWALCIWILCPWECSGGGENIDSFSSSLGFGESAASFISSIASCSACASALAFSAANFAARNSSSTAASCNSCAFTSATCLPFSCANRSLVIKSRLRACCSASCTIWRLIASSRSTCCCFSWLAKSAAWARTLSIAVCIVFKCASDWATEELWSLATSASSCSIVCRFLVTPKRFASSVLMRLSISNLSEALAAIDSFVFKSVMEAWKVSSCSINWDKPCISSASLAPTWRSCSSASKASLLANRACSSFKCSSLCCTTPLSCKRTFASSSSNFLRRSVSANKLASCFSTCLSWAAFKPACTIFSLMDANFETIICVVWRRFWESSSSCKISFSRFASILACCWASACKRSAIFWRSSWRSFSDCSWASFICNFNFFISASMLSRFLDSAASKASSRRISWSCVWRSISNLADDFKSFNFIIIDILARFFFSSRADCKRNSSSFSFIKRALFSASLFMRSCIISFISLMHSSASELIASNLVCIAFKWISCCSCTLLKQRVKSSTSLWAASLRSTSAWIFASSLAIRFFTSSCSCSCISSVSFSFNLKMAATDRAIRVSSSSKTTRNSSSFSAIALACRTSSALIASLVWFLSICNSFSAFVRNASNCSRKWFNSSSAARRLAVSALILTFSSAIALANASLSSACAAEALSSCNLEIVVIETMILLSWSSPFLRTSLSLSANMLMWYSACWARRSHPRRRSVMTFSSACTRISSIFLVIWAICTLLFARKTSSCSSCAETSSSLESSSACSILKRFSAFCKDCQTRSRSWCTCASAWKLIFSNCASSSGTLRLLSFSRSSSTFILCSSAFSWRICSISSPSLSSFLDLPVSLATMISERRKFFLPSCAFAFMACVCSWSICTFISESSRIRSAWSCFSSCTHNSTCILAFDTISWSSCKCFLAFATFWTICSRSFFISASSFWCLLDDCFSAELSSRFLFGLSCLLFASASNSLRTSISNASSFSASREALFSRWVFSSSAIRVRTSTKYGSNRLTPASSFCRMLFISSCKSLRASTISSIFISSVWILAVWSLRSVSVCTCVWRSLNFLISFIAVTTCDW